MNYLLDKKIKNKKFFRIASLIFVFLILFYFRLGIWSGFSSAGHAVFRPVLIFGNNLGGKLESVGSYFMSKSSLLLQNQNLQSKLNEDEAKMSNYDSIALDDASLKEILGRKDAKANMILSAILSKPNQSPYDTLVIDAGALQGIKIGDTVFALGDVPIGVIAETYSNSSKVVLFSSSGEKTQVVISSVSVVQADKNLPAGRQGVFMDAIGRGGGNFEMIAPRDLVLAKGDQAVLPGINPYVLGIVETIISDPRDPFNKALLVSPVNIQELKFVEVEIK